MAETPKEEVLFHGFTSFAQAVEVREVNTKAPGVTDPKTILVRIADGDGISTFIFKREEAGQLAVDIFGALANHGDANSKRILDLVFKRQ